MAGVARSQIGTKFPSLITRFRLQIYTELLRDNSMLFVTNAWGYGIEVTKFCVSEVLSWMSRRFSDNSKKCKQKRALRYSNSPTPEGLTNKFHVFPFSNCEGGNPDL